MIVLVLTKCHVAAAIATSPGTVRAGGAEVMEPRCWCQADLNVEGGLDNARAVFSVLVFWCL